MKLVYLVAVASLGVAAAAQAAKTSADSAFFQESYDQEALGKDQEAMAALDKLSPANSGSYVALLRKGWLQYRLGQNQPAIEEYSKAIAAAPRAVEPRLGILLPLLAEKQWANAEKHARALLTLDPESYLGTLRLAFALYNQGKFAESKTLYQKVIDDYPSDTEARSGLGWAMLKLHKKKEGAAVFRALLEFAPKNPLGQQGLAAASGK